MDPDYSPVEEQPQAPAKPTTAVLASPAPTASVAPAGTTAPSSQPVQQGWTDRRMRGGAYAYGWNESGKPIDDPLYTAMSARGAQMAREMNAKGQLTSAQWHRDLNERLRANDPTDPFIQSLTRIEQHSQDYADDQDYQRQLRIAARNAEGAMYHDYRQKAMAYAPMWRKTYEEGMPMSANMTPEMVNERTFAANRFVEDQLQKWVNGQMPDSREFENPNSVHFAGKGIQRAVRPWHKKPDQTPQGLVNANGSIYGDDSAITIPNAGSGAAPIANAASPAKSPAGSPAASSPSTGGGSVSNAPSSATQGEDSGTEWVMPAIGAAAVAGDINGYRLLRNAQQMTLNAAHAAENAKGLLNPDMAREAAALAKRLGPRAAKMMKVAGRTPVINAVVSAGEGVFNMFNNPNLANHVTSLGDAIEHGDPSRIDLASGVAADVDFLRGVSNIAGIPQFAGAMEMGLAPSDYRIRQWERKYGMNSDPFGMRGVGEYFGNMMFKQNHPAPKKTPNQPTTSSPQEKERHMSWQEVLVQEANKKTKAQMERNAAERRGERNRNIDKL